MISQPTTESTDLLEQQLAQAADGVTTSQWGRTSGYLDLLLEQELFKDATGLNDKVDRLVKPALVHKDITKDSTAYIRLMKQEEQKATIRDWERQESVDSLLVDHIVGSVDPQYLEVLNKKHMGFAGETTKTLITYIRTAWCRVSTHNKMKARSAFRGPWYLTSHVVTYAWRMDAQ